MPPKIQEEMTLEIMKEKMYLKSLDYKAEKDEVKHILDGQVEERHDLSIGNDCLRHMTLRQIMMPVAMNAKVFSERPRAERVTMQRCPLSTSIVRNDGKLFRYCKRLMKEDSRRVKYDNVKQNRKLELEEAKAELEYRNDKREKHEEMFLHKQVMADSYKSRQIEARLINQNLQKIRTELERTSGDFPFLIKALDDKIKERQKELRDFLELREKGKKHLALEKRHLKPLNRLLNLTTAHFEKAIAAEKAELDERKKNSLHAFLAEREAHAFNYRDSNNIEEMKMKARNTSLVNAQDILIKLMDSMLVADIKYVVDCISDQEDVTLFLKQERKKRLEENANLKADLERLANNHDALRYNDKRQAKMRETLSRARLSESEQRTRYEKLDDTVRQQDKLVSEIGVALHALSEKLRPIKLPDPENKYLWNMAKDAEHVILKLTKMKELVESDMVQVSRVRPTMLHLFMEKRVPPDSVRVDPNMTAAGTMTGFDSFEADQPGYVTRETLKQKSDEAAKAQAKNKSKAS